MFGFFRKRPKEPVVQSVLEPYVSPHPIWISLPDGKRMTGKSTRMMHRLAQYMIENPNRNVMCALMCARGYYLSDKFPKEYHACLKSKRLRELGKVDYSVLERNIRGNNNAVFIDHYYIELMERTGEYVRLIEFLYTLNRKIFWIP